jgi:hypothetical protein
MPDIGLMRQGVDWFWPDAPANAFLVWLLLDSMVVDVPMASNPTFVTLSSLKPFFFNGLQNE